MEPSDTKAFQIAKVGSSETAMKAKLLLSSTSKPPQHQGQSPTPHAPSAVIIVDICNFMLHILDHHFSLS